MVKTANAIGRISVTSNPVVITTTARLRFPHKRLCTISITGHVETTTRVDQIKIGDRVTARYAEALSLELKKTKAPLDAKGTAAITRAAPGARPGGAAGREITFVADVVDVDQAKSTISLKGPSGNVVNLKVQNPDHFKVVKKGDQVEAVYTQAIAVAVTPAKGADKK